MVNILVIVCLTSSCSDLQQASMENIKQHMKQEFILEIQQRISNYFKNSNVGTYLVNYDYTLTTCNHTKHRKLIKRVQHSLHN